MTGVSTLPKGNLIKIQAQKSPTTGLDSLKLGHKVLLLWRCDAVKDSYCVCVCVRGVAVLRTEWSVELEWHCAPEGAQPTMCCWSQSLSDLISLIITLMGFKLLLKLWKIEWANYFLSKRHIRIDCWQKKALTHHDEKYNVINWPQSWHRHNFTGQQ